MSCEVVCLEELAASKKMFKTQKKIIQVMTGVRNESLLWQII
jgi:hypothetical protein